MGMKESLIDLYDNIKIDNSFSHIKDGINETFVSFLDGCKVEIYGTDPTKVYNVKFINKEFDNTLFETKLSVGMWTMPNVKYYIDWKIQVNDELFDFDLTDETVYISFESSALGDSIAWMPAVEDFRLKHNCKILLSTFWNQLFKNDYSEIKFIEPNTLISENVYAHYKVGCYDDNYDRNKNNWKTIPIQKIAYDILGLNYKNNIKPKIKKLDFGRQVYDKYVTFTPFSTMKSKLWNCENGWQNVIDYLNGIGYKVVLLGKDDSNDYKNVIKFTNRSIEEVINCINYSEFFIGLGSGLSWLSWALNKEVIMISGFSKPFTEFDCYRIINEKVCNGCFNENYVTFRRDKWDCCAHDKNFECTTSISADVVIEKINEIIKK